MILGKTIKEIVTGLVILIITCLINEALKVIKEAMLTQNKSIVENSKEYKKIIEKNLFVQAKSFLDEIIKVSVLAMEQSKAGDIRKKVKEGSLDRKYLLNLSKEVLENIKEQINYETKYILNNNINNLDNYIKNGIEATVAKLKQGGDAFNFFVPQIEDNEKEEIKDKNFEGIENVAKK